MPEKPCTGCLPSNGTTIPLIGPAPMYWPDVGPFSNVAAGSTARPTSVLSPVADTATPTPATTVAPPSAAAAAKRRHRRVAESLDLLGSLIGHLLHVHTEDRFLRNLSGSPRPSSGRPRCLGLPPTVTPNPVIRATAARSRRQRDVQLGTGRRDVRAKGRGDGLRKPTPAGRAFAPRRSRDRSVARRRFGFARHFR